MRAVNLLAAIFAVATASPYRDFAAVGISAKNLEEDAKLSVPEIIQKYGYPCEKHSVQTTDGYILEMHRIPYGKQGPSKDRPAVYLHHGLEMSSAEWVIPGPGKGLAYMLADAGYDVWMGNCRGNRYSRKHSTLSPLDKQFWDFSWHQIGVYDVPAMIDYVIATVDQQKIFYIGFQEGATVFYVMTTDLKQYNDKIKAMFGMAPIAYLGPASSRLPQLLAQGNGSISSLYDFNLKTINETLIPVIRGHTPSGGSIKEWMHYLQLYEWGWFRQWDYGVPGNLKHYGTVLPPSYHLSGVTAPVYVYYSIGDEVVSETYVLFHYNLLGNAQKMSVLPDTFTHLDFCYGIEAPNLVYSEIIDLMDTL